MDDSRLYGVHVPEYSHSAQAVGRRFVDMDQVDIDMRSSRNTCSRSAEAAQIVGSFHLDSKSLSKTAAAAAAAGKWSHSPGCMVAVEHEADSSSHNEPPVESGFVLGSYDGAQQQPPS